MNEEGRKPTELAFECHFLLLTVGDEFESGSRRELRAWLLSKIARIGQYLQEGLGWFSVCCYSLSRARILCRFTAISAPFAFSSPLPFFALPELFKLFSLLVLRAKRLAFRVRAQRNFCVFYFLASGSNLAMAMAVMMRSQDRVPEICVAEDDCNNSCLDICDERQDMWSLIKPELQANTFSSLLSGARGNAAAKPWDLVSSKPYGRSRSSLSNDSLQLCTEGLGCESSDCLTDCSCSSSEFADDYLSDDEEDQEMIDTVKKGANAAPARAFPPPLASISACNPSYMRSFKKDGRFVLRSVKAPLQSNNFLHSYREGGRLKMQLISRNDDDFPLLQASNPEDEIDQDEPEEAAADEDQHQDLEAESESCFWDSDEVPVSEKFSDTSLAGLESVSTDESFPAMIHFSDVVFNGGFATAGFKAPCNSSPERTSNSKLNEFQDEKKSSDTRPAGKQRLGSSCLNAYSGWRTALAGKATSKVSSGFYDKSLVNYRAKDGEPLKFNVNVNANECFGHCPLRRCHEPTKPLSVWGESQCIATSS